MNGERKTASNTIRRWAFCSVALLVAAAAVFINVRATSGEGSYTYFDTTTQAQEITTLSGFQQLINILFPDNTTADQNGVTTSPVNVTGTGVVQTDPPTAAPTTYNYNVNDNDNQVMYVYTTAPTMPVLATVSTAITTTEPVSSTVNSALNQLFATTAPVLVATTREQFTLNPGGLLVDEDDGKNGFTWQTFALIGAAVVFVVLAALLIVLMTQKKKLNDMGGISRPYNADSLSRLPTAGVTEFENRPEEDRVRDYFEGTDSATTAERVAEMNIDMTSGASRREAKAIREAAESGMISGGRNYGDDDIIRKYTRDPVGFGSRSDDDVPAEVLNRTDNMLLDLDSYSAAVSGFSSSDPELRSVISGKSGAEGIARRCPACGAVVPAGDLFCHDCGEYVG